MIKNEAVQTVSDRIRPFAEREPDATPESGPVFRSAMPEGTTPISLDDRLLEVEASLISWALRITRGNKSKAAELLKIKRSTLGDRANRCGLGRSQEETPATASQPT